MRWQLVALTLIVAQVVVAESTVPPTVVPTNTFQSVRSTLVPVVEDTLNRVCGNDCPGFSVIPNLKNGQAISGDPVEDIGFEELPKNAAEISKEVGSVTIDILANKKMEPTVLDSIKATVVAEARNHTELPVSVRAKAVTLPPAANHADEQVTPKDLIDLAKTGLWPLALICLGLLGIGALGYYFHQKRKTAIALANAAMIDESTGEEVGAPEEIILNPGPSIDIFSERFADLRFFLNDCAQRGDLGALRKVVRLFPGDSLSKKLDLSPNVPAMISKAIGESVSGEGASEGQTIEWLKHELDIAHWKRLKEASDPMAKVSNLSDAQLTSLFLQIPSSEGKALVLSQTDSEQWPKLLSTLKASEKVSVGSDLSKFQSTGGGSHETARKEVLESLERVLKVSHLENLLDEYVLYLSEDETMALANQLSSVSGLSTRRKSVEEMIVALDDKELLEMVLRLEVDQIRTLLEHLPTEPQQKILGSLPKKLRERVGFFQNSHETDQTKQDPKWLQTRSRLLKMYQQRNSRSVH